jgi:iron complex transport system substrate-binding protein
MVVTALAALVLSACAATGATPVPPTPPASPATTAPGGATTPETARPAFPRQVTSYPNRPVTIPAEPRRIAALSTDVAEVALMLAGPERVVAVPVTNENPYLSGNVDLARQVGIKLPQGNNPDPEQILSMTPDLVLITTRHGGEQDANALLERTGLPVVAFGGWATVDEVRANIRTIGKAVGEDAKAEVRAMVDRAGGPKPVVLALSNQSPIPFIVGPGAVTYDVLVHAGAMPAPDVIGLQRTAPASVEQLINADPEFILLVDVLGKGIESYDELLKNPAVRTVRAVRQGKVAIVPARSVFAASPRIVDGIYDVATWIHGGAAPASAARP